MLRSFRYEEIAEDLRQQIQQGIYQEGTRLPAERELMQRYGVQRNTIRQSLTLLQKEGWLEVKPRSGVFVAPTQDGTSTGESTISNQSLEGVVLVINAWNQSSTALENILVGLSHTLENTALTVQRFNSQCRPGGWFHVLPTPEYLAANRVVGAILWAQNPTDLVALARLRAAVPTVLVDRRVLGFEADEVGFDDVAGGRAITQHLIAQGHQQIGFLADEVFAETVQQRWQGYTLALEEAGIVPEPSRFALFEEIREPLFSAYMRLFLAGAESPLTAVVCSNDSTALTMLRFLRREGYRVPEDVAVTGYGNLLPDYLDTLELTTMAQPFQEVGKAAGELLLERLRSGSTASHNGGYQQVKLPVHLIVRKSSGASNGEGRMK